jgi:hypothetical protein
MAMLVQSMRALRFDGESSGPCPQHPNMTLLLRLPLFEDSIIGA